MSKTELEERKLDMQDRLYIRLIMNVQSNMFIRGDKAMTEAHMCGLKDLATVATNVYFKD